MRTCVITVTYGKRHLFVKKLIDQLVQMGVNELVVVNNASEPESTACLVEYARSSAMMIQLVHLGKNMGSAGGFKWGIEHAEKNSSCDFFWLLDDDNLPQINALEAHYNEYKKLAPNSCLLSLRINRPYRKIFNSSDVKRKFRPNNSFIELNIVHAITRNFQHSQRKNSLVKIPYAAYGGFFFNKSILSIVGYPNEKFFLYMDDHDFTLRISRANFDIFLNRNSIVEDMEGSWHVTKKYKFLKRFKLLIHENETKIYHIVRNVIFLERKYFLTNKFLYGVNRILFKSIFYSLCYLVGRRDRIRLFKKAYQDSFML